MRPQHRVEEVDGCGRILGIAQHLFEGKVNSWIDSERHKAVCSWSVGQLLDSYLAL